jgi:predicted NBD/HSP70 family sugar kinase
MLETADSANDMPSDNERMILEIVRRSQGITRAGVTGLTNLTQQSVHRIIDALIEREFLLLGEPVIQGRGKPSPVVRLNPEARYSVGISVNTDSASFCITDFACSAVHEETLEISPEERARTLRVLHERVKGVMTQQDIAAKRIAGIGFAMAGFFVGDEGQFNTPEPLRDWSLVDLRAELHRLFGTRVWTENNATTGAIGECVLGAGLTYPTFGYLSFNYGFGSGIVIDGKPFTGSFQNAGEISRVYTIEEGPSRPALGELIKRLNARGIPIRTVSALRSQFDPDWPGVAEWIEEVTPFLNRAIDAMRGVIDPAAIVFGGELPPRLGHLLLAVPPSREVPRYGRPAKYPHIFQSVIKGDPAVLGAALIPLKNQYFQ